MRNKKDSDAGFSRRILAASILLLASLLRSQDAEPKDFSTTNAVTIIFGEGERGTRVSGSGLEHRSRGRDGRTTPENIQGIPCRSLHLTEAKVPKGYFFFAIDPTFKDRDVGRVRIEVDYFDGVDPQGPVFGVQYDAKGSEENPAFSVKQVLPNVVLKGSGRWLKTVFHLNDARFANSQGGRADFRLWASPPELSVSRLTLSLERSPLLQSAPLRFNATGEAPLTNWNLQWDSGGKPSFSTLTGNQNETRSLIIRAPGAFSVGSWRTCVLLEPGFYQFIGKAKQEGFEAGPEENRAGVTIRISGRSTPNVVTDATDWKTLLYDFTLATQEYVELVCELCATQGTVRFDIDSLRLLRRNKPE